MRRRDFIKGLGGLSALGVLPGLGGSLAFAENAAPKRFLLLSHCHGWPYDSWRMRPSDAAQMLRSDGSYQALVNRHGVRLCDHFIGTVNGSMLSTGSHLPVPNSTSMVTVTTPVGFMHGLERKPILAGRTLDLSLRRLTNSLQGVSLEMTACRRWSWLSMMPKRPGDPLPIVPRAVGYRLRPIQHAFGVVSLDPQVRPIL